MHSLFFSGVALGHFDAALYFLATSFTSGLWKIVSTIIGGGYSVAGST